MRVLGAGPEVGEGDDMSDFESARQSMVESQLRPSQVTDRRLFAAFAALPRERFVPPAKQTARLYGCGS